jgi:D-beta-D-heptose 7-phosphate kinase/D-beta-D-heptose 1-phosphate adenosyltransferase
MLQTHAYADGQVDPLFEQYRKKIVLDYEKLRKVVEGYQSLGQKVVVTIGSWDALHIGHVRYIIQARARGDVLIVALDSDRAVKLYKGPLRPLIPDHERAEMLSYLGDLISFITVIDDVDENGWWQCGLLKIVKPDIFVAVEDSYPEEQIKEIRSFGSEVLVLPRQAEYTSTSALIEATLKKNFLPAFQEALDGTLQRRKPVSPNPALHTSTS